MKSIVLFVSAIAIIVGISSTTISAGGHQNPAGILNMTITVPESEEKKVDAFFAEHASWMKKTHHLVGSMEPVITSYKILKSPVYKNPMNPADGTTGEIIYVISEEYKRPAGLQKHLEMGQKWERIKEMNEMFGKYMGMGKATFVAFPKVIQSYP